MVRQIYGEKGIRGFYTGFGINLIRILPNTAILFMSYEYLSKILAKQYYKVWPENMH